MSNRAIASITFNTLAVQDHLKTHAIAGEGDEEAPGERP
jgi:hypothetical protein